MEFTSPKEKRITEYFRISVLLKGVFSLIEISAGVLALFFPVSAVTNFVIALAQGELVEEPGDFVATHLLSFAQQLSVPSGIFVAMYLLSRGLIQLGLVVALLKNKLWAYPSSLVVLGLFIVYQAYQIVLTSSLPLLALTVFDLVVMWFIWREYEVVRLRSAQ
jgi:uncharacterized membrane protein